MQKNIKVDVSQIKYLLRDMFNEKYIKNGVAIDAIFNMLSESDIDLLMHIYSRPDYKFLSLNQKVKFNPSKYDLENTNIDTLIDLGYANVDGWHYGIVKGDTSYNSGFNPTYHRMVVQTMATDTNNDLISIEIEVYTSALYPVEDNEGKWKGLE